MKNRERETFCRIAASFFYPPDEHLVDLVEDGGLYTVLEKYGPIFGGDETRLNGFRREGKGRLLLPVLKAEYDRLFAGWTNEAVPLVESCYKPWTEDPTCGLPFALEKGLLMGDPALHLLEIYRQCGLEMKEEFRGCPDHLVLELEFLSYLYRWATDREVRSFIEGHLDWIPWLRESCEGLRPHPFYRSAIEVVDLFLITERKRLEMEAHGKRKERVFFSASSREHASRPGLWEG